MFLINIQTGLAVAAVCLGGIGIGAAVALVTAPISPRLALAKEGDIRIAPPAHSPAGVSRMTAQPVALSLRN